MSAFLSSKELLDTMSPVWPNDRSYDDIMRLHTRWNDLNAADRLECLDLTSLIRTEDCVLVDLGMGNGQFLIDLAVKLAGLNKRAELMGISASPDEIQLAHCLEQGISITQGKLPQAKFYAISGTLGDKDGKTVFGNANTRAKIVEFFALELGISLEFTFTEIASRIKPGVAVWDLLVQFSGSSKNLSFDDYLPLMKKANNFVGIPHKDPASEAWYEYADFSIDMRTYRPRLRASQSPSGFFASSSMPADSPAHSIRLS